MFLGSYGKVEPRLKINYWGFSNNSYKDISDKDTGSLFSEDSKYYTTANLKDFTLVNSGIYGVYKQGVKYWIQIKQGVKVSEGVLIKPRSPRTFDAWVNATPGALHMLCKKPIEPITVWFESDTSLWYYDNVGFELVNGYFKEGVKRLQIFNGIESGYGPDC